MTKVKWKSGWQTSDTGDLSLSDGVSSVFVCLPLDFIADFENAQNPPRRRRMEKSKSKTASCLISTLMLGRWGGLVTVWPLNLFSTRPQSFIVVQKYADTAALKRCCQWLRSRQKNCFLMDLASCLGPLWCWNGNVPLPPELTRKRFIAANILCCQETDSRKLDPSDT